MLGFRLQHLQLARIGMRIGDEDNRVDFLFWRRQHNTCLLRGEFAMCPQPDTASIILQTFTLTNIFWLLASYLQLRSSLRRK